MLLILAGISKKCIARQQTIRDELAAESQVCGARQAYRLANALMLLDRISITLLPHLMYDTRMIFAQMEGCFMETGCGAVVWIDGYNVAARKCSARHVWSLATP